MLNISALQALVSLALLQFAMTGCGQPSNTYADADRPGTPKQSDSNPTTKCEGRNTGETGATSADAMGSGLPNQGDKKPTLTCEGDSNDPSPNQNGEHGSGSIIGRWQYVSGFGPGILTAYLNVQPNSVTLKVVCPTSTAISSSEATVSDTAITVRESLTSTNNNCFAGLIRGVKPYHFVHTTLYLETAIGRVSEWVPE